MVTQRGVIVLALALASCKQPKRPPAEVSSEAAANQVRAAKLAGYIECLNKHSARVFEIADLYRDRFEHQAPTPRSNLLLQAPGDPAECLEHLQVAKLMAPTLPELERAGDAFGRALGAVFLLTTEAHAYYDPVDPAHAPPRGVALHSALLASFREFDVAQGRLFDQVYELNRATHVEQLDHREVKEGRKLTLVAEWMMMRAQDLVRFAAMPPDEIASLDHGLFAAELSKFADSIEEMTAYAHANPEQTDKWKGFWAFEDFAREYLIAAKQFAERAQGNVPYTDSEKIMIAANNEASVTGTPAAMVKAYNRLVALW